MFKRHYQKRSHNILFVIFRTILSMIIFAVLILGAYSAYKQFSGLNPLKLDLKTLALNFVSHHVEQLDYFGLATKLLSVGLKQSQPAKEPGQVSGEQTSTTATPEPVKNPPVSFKFALFADSHNENYNLKKAINQVKLDPNVSLIIGLGDYTETGTLSELEKVKQVFDEAKIRYFVTAGDHDLWDSRDKGKLPTENFVKIFGLPYKSFTYQNARFILLYNSDNYFGLGQEQKDWLKNELQRIQGEDKSIFVMLHEPLYHPSSDRAMGKVTVSLSKEAKELIGILKNAGVKEVFAGDTHFFLRYADPDPGLPMTAVGALASAKNAQNPRFLVVTVYEDGSYKVDDTEVK